MLLPLEAELNARAQDDPDAEDLWSRYGSMKKHLETEYYRWVQANCPYYTDHGEQHIRSVIECASLLLKEQLHESRSDELSSVDIFLLLSSILWHDVGNVLSRSKHHELVAELTKKVKSLGFPNPDLQRLVNEISLAHKGPNGLAKVRSHEDLSTNHKNYSVYPSAIASLLRFADEISENQARISHAIKDKVPDDNKIYWEYASCVSASIPVPSQQVVRLTVNMPLEKATLPFLCNDYPHRFPSGEITLVEYILCRIEKMNNERAYCMSALSRYVTVKELEVRFTLMRDNARIDQYEETVVFGDGGMKSDGYPNIEVFSNFFESNPNWKPEVIEGLA